MKKTLLTCFVCVLAFGFAQAQTQYYSETFESGAASGWTIEDQWAFGNNASLSSAYLNYNGNDTEFAAFNDDGAGNGHVGGGRMISPAIDLSAVSGTLFLEANVFFTDADYQGANETLMLSVSTDGGATWTLIEDYGQLGWTRRAYDFSAYAGEMVMLSFEYQDGNGWNFGAAIDDVGISDDLFFTPRKSFSLSLRGASEVNAIQPNLDYALEALIFNSGSAFEPETITSFEVAIAGQTYPYDNVNIEPDGVMIFEIPAGLNSGTTPSDYKLALTSVNGMSLADLSAEANEPTMSLNPVSDLQEDKAVVVEEATGSWCPWCTRGTTYLNEMTKRFPDHFVGVAVHNADEMVLSEYDNAVTSFPGFLGFPSVLFNREEIIDPSAIVMPSVVGAQTAPVATLEIGAAEDGTTFQSSVKVHFKQAVTANHNVSIIMTEDNISDAAAAYNQANAYSGGGAGPMGGFEFLSGDVPSTLIDYDHVGRALIGGFAGVNEVVGDFEVGSSPAVYMEDFTIPADWVTDNMHVIAVLTDASGEVVNAKSYKYSDVINTGLVTNVEEILDADFVKLYPNPADQIANVAINLENSSEVSAELIDNLGRKVLAQNFGEIQGVNTLKLDVSTVNAGSYILQIRVNDKLVIRKLSVQ